MGRSNIDVKCGSADLDVSSSCYVSCLFSCSCYQWLGNEYETKCSCFVLICFLLLDIRDGFDFMLELNCTMII